MIKELLFSGARRKARNLLMQTPQKIFEEKAECFDEDQLINMRYILSRPKGCRWCATTRTIEKSERSTKLQLAFLVFDFFNIIVFVVAAAYNAQGKLSNA